MKLLETSRELYEIIPIQKTEGLLCKIVKNLKRGFRNYPIYKWPQEIYNKNSKNQRQSIISSVIIGIVLKRLAAIYGC